MEGEYTVVEDEVLVEPNLMNAEFRRQKELYDNIRASCADYCNLDIEYKTS